MKERLKDTRVWFLVLIPFLLLTLVFSALKFHLMQNIMIVLLLGFFGYQNFLLRQKVSRLKRELRR